MVLGESFLWPLFVLFLGELQFHTNTSIDYRFKYNYYTSLFTSI